MEIDFKTRKQTGVIVFGGSIFTEDHIKNHVDQAMTNGFHVLRQVDHAKLFAVEKDSKTGIFEKPVYIQ